jgi:hypothetical protein
MSKAPDSAFTVETAALFPKSYFLENLVTRADGSILVTATNQGELWYVPNAAGELPVTPALLDTLDSLPMGIVEVEPDVFYVCTTGEAALERYDLRGWTPGTAVTRERVFAFPTSASGLNGTCLLGHNVLLIADGTAGLIWRLDLADDGRSAKAAVWLRDNSMAAGWDLPQVVLTPKVTIPYPGVNGVRFASKTNFLYYTSCAQQLFARVAVDPDTLDAIGLPEVIQNGILSADDFCIDEAAGVAYIGTHVANTIRRVSLNPTKSPKVDIVSGEPFNDKLVGPSSLYWAPEAEGRVAYITTDGGLLAPGPDGIVHSPALLRLTIKESASARKGPDAAFPVHLANGAIDAAQPPADHGPTAHLGT